MLTFFDDFGRWHGPTYRIDPETGECRVVTTENGHSVLGMVRTGGIESSLDVKGAAEILGCSTGQIHKLCNSGEISFHWVGTKRRFTCKDLEEFRTRNTIQPRDNVSDRRRTKTEGGKEKQRDQKPRRQEHNDARAEVSREDLKRRISEWH